MRRNLATILRPGRARLRKHQLIRASYQQEQSSHGGHGVHGLTAAIDQWLKSPPWLRARPDRYESLSAILTISDQTGPLKAINSLLPTRAVRATETTSLLLSEPIARPRLRGLQSPSDESRQDCDNRNVSFYRSPAGSAVRWDD